VDLRTSFHTRRGIVRAVDGVSLSVSPGRVLGIVGESGSGKTVTALSVMGLIESPGRLEAGSKIFFAGSDLVKLSEEDMRSIRGKDIAMIFQEPMTSLNPVHKVGSQISETVKTHERVSQQEAHSRAVELLALVGIPDAARRCNDYPYEMSGGMRQRVMIAIAMACHPRLLIADEPTTALDVTIQAQILSLMAELREQTGMAMLIITHDLGVIAEVAEEVVVMYAGQIVESGPTRDVLDAPQHPYTQALLESMPVLGASRQVPLKVIPGSVPNPLEWPLGCRFAPRCERAFERCARQPPLFRKGRQQSACWLREVRTPFEKHTDGAE
jgi:oligopeptide/dipeptide ABC transporter ATP-binding protein